MDIERESLPSGAVPCEYIEATSSSQKVDTGLYASQKLQIVLKGQMVFPSSYSNKTWLFGLWNTGYGSPHNSRSYLIGCYYSYLRCEAGPDTSQYWANISRDNDVHTYSILNDGAYIDDIRLADTDFDYLPTSRNSLTLINCNHVNGGTVTKRVYSFKAIDLDGEIVMNLLPGYDQKTSQAGFYDTVSKTWLFGVNGVVLGYKPA